MEEKRMMIITGIIVGLFGGGLVLLGNPVNMGFCIACFLRDIAGALGTHQAAVVQNIRPEVIGLILGSFIISKVSGEFRPMAGSATATRFLLGIFIMFGSLIFLGCPLRMVLRLAGGDLTAIPAFLGFIVGIIIGTEFLKKGFNLGRSYRQGMAEGYTAPVFAVALLLLLLFAPSMLVFSQEGPGSMGAPLVVTLVAGLIVGALAQRSRLCMAGGIRDIYLIKDFTLFNGFIFIFLVALIVNVFAGNFEFGFEGQPVAHTDHLFNFLGMALVGICAILLGGCPLRQLILSGSGDGDATVTVFGMVTGGALAHNFGVAASPEGVSTVSIVTLVIGFIFVFGVAFLNMESIGLVSKSSKSIKG
ncbi:YedE family putative selenium transporter [Natranaerobius trueperi]|uniref:YedE-related selenium metabolism membrane protein n=1 Tax=Natranaerobius trueperi TaxID=759412 RepID=A0A226C1F9_9FIRM|nr:YedE family putative selenium transporter [Natranaerobius trueperi]OWZ85021.1 YedE-related selenium metabolism membrane protein [Natranaerobius trueperi]